MKDRSPLEEIAQHHAEIAAVAQSLRSAIDAGDHPGVKSLLVRLQAIEVRHYAAEDALMRAVGYGEAESHRAQHATMIDTLAQINSTLALENPATVNPQIVAHLEEALAHMAGADEKLHRFVTARVQGPNS